MADTATEDEGCCVRLLMPVARSPKRSSARTPWINAHAHGCSHTLPPVFGAEAQFNASFRI